MMKFDRPLKDPCWCPNAKPYPHAFSSECQDWTKDPRPLLTAAKIVLKAYNGGPEDMECAITTLRSAVNKYRSRRNK